MTASARSLAGVLLVAIGDELDADQQAAAAHVADQPDALLQLGEPLAAPSAPTLAAFSTRPSSSMISMVVSAARAVTGFFSCV